MKRIGLICTIIVTGVASIGALAEEWKYPHPQFETTDVGDYKATATALDQIFQYCTEKHKQFDNKDNNYWTQCSWPQTYCSKEKYKQRLQYALEDAGSLDSPAFKNALKDVWLTCIANYRNAVEEDYKANNKPRLPE